MAGVVGEGVRARVEQEARRASQGLDYEGLSSGSAGSSRVKGSCGDI